MKTTQLGILFIILLFTEISFASEKDSVKIKDIIDRSLQREEYFATFAKVPSMLTAWDNLDYAFISSGFTSAKGTYTHPQLLFSRNLFELKTESIKSFPKKGWRFFGSVSYTNGSAKTGKWNMSYYLPSNGSPFYYMIEQEGTWKTQSYDFNVAMQKNLSERLSFGVALKYLGDLTFRTIDTRNDNTTLEMQILPSLTLRLGEKNIASFGLFYNRKKNQTSMNNKYQHGTEPEKYHLFLNEGLGTWDNSPLLMSTTDAQFGVVASWRKMMTKGVFDVIYSMHTGNEDWLLNSISTLQDRRENFARYNSLSQELNLRYKRVGDKGTWLSNLEIKNILGTSSIYKVPANVYQENFESTILKANLFLGYLKNESILKQVYANVNFDNSSQYDYNYGHSIDYSNLETTLAADFSFGNKRDINFIFGGFASYKMNLAGDHSPMAAAGNFYTTSIAMPAFAFLTSDYCKFGLKLGSEFNISKEYRFEVIIKGDFTKPVSVMKYQDKATFTLNDNYYNLSINLCYNF